MTSKKVIVSLSLLSTIAFHITLNANSLENIHKSQLMVYGSSALQDGHLIYDGKNFHVLCNGKDSLIPDCFVDKQIRNLDQKKLHAFAQVGYLTLSKFNNTDEYKIQAHVRGQGGGLATGQVAYWATRVSGWGAFAAAVWMTGGEALAHSAEAYEAIEIAAHAALVLGTAAPTP